MGTAVHPTLSASPLSSANPRLPPKPVTPLIPRLTSRRSLLASSAGFLSSAPLLDLPPRAAAPSPAPSAPAFFEIPGSGGVKALDLREGSGETPIDGDRVSIHYYGRLAAKQGWRFDSTYDHKDEMGDPVPFLFVLGSGKVISGIEAAVKSMKVGGTRRVIIPPSQGYQNTSQEPIPPNVRSLLSSTEVLVSLAPANTCLILKLLVASCAYCSLENVLKKHQHIYSRACIQLLDFELVCAPTSRIRFISILSWTLSSHLMLTSSDLQFFDRQRLFTTIFNPTRLANGEGSTLGTLIFDIQLVSTRHS
ncbi:Peptidyl-prolyl cis-trans isomerase [Musa troglodytarum]|uniref:peptidylprolyl isomerase n=1 Tax=Musa troglodytarum TaxID=320322 RepID=A0A9E7H413_9LILI|nr:Peptidyl-prolyl cis-trans isomerase [Musa troglodytarum]